MLLNNWIINVQRADLTYFPAILCDMPQALVVTTSGYIRKIRQMKVGQCSLTHMYLVKSIIVIE